MGCTPVAVAVAVPVAVAYFDEVVVLNLDHPSTFRIVVVAVAVRTAVVVR